MKFFRNKIQPKHFLFEKKEFISNVIYSLKNSNLSGLNMSPFGFLSCYVSYFIDFFKHDTDTKFNQTNTNKQEIFYKTR